MKKRFILFIVAVLVMGVGYGQAFYDTLRVARCANDLPYHWTENESDYDIGGTYDVDYSSITICECDSIYTLILTVNPVFYDTLRVARCVNDLPYHWTENNTDYDVGGTYDVDYSSIAIGGCDSIYTLILTVNPVFYDTLRVARCANELPYHWTENNTDYDVGGTYDVDYSNIAIGGCDSIYTLVLTINEFVETTFSPVACDSYTWIFPGGSQNYTSTTTDLKTFKTIAGCDSIVTMKLTVNAASSISLFSGTQSPTVCQNTAITNIVFTLGGSATGSSISWSPSTPAGITYNTGTRTISGTPTGSGTFTYTITTTGHTAPCTAATIGGTIIVNELPNYVGDSTLTTCSGTPLYFPNAPIGFTYTWSSNNLDYTTVGTKKYSVTVTDTTTNCEKPFTEVLTVTVSDKPTIANISTPSTVCSESNLSLLTPDINPNGSAVSTQYWEIEKEIGTYRFEKFTYPYTVTFSDNGKKIRYFATNDCGTTYSNTVILTIPNPPDSIGIIKDPNFNILHACGNLERVCTYQWGFNPTYIGVPSTISNINLPHDFNSEKYNYFVVITYDCENVSCTDTIYYNLKNPLPKFCKLVEPLPPTKSEIKLFPNPAKNELNIDIEIKEDIKSADLQIIEITGKVVMQSKIAGRQSKINISELKTGFYILMVKTENTVLTSKFIVE